MSNTTIFKVTAPQQTTIISHANAIVNHAPGFNGMHGQAGFGQTVSANPAYQNYAAVLSSLGLGQFSQHPVIFFELTVDEAKVLNIIAKGISISIADTGENANQPTLKAAEIPSLVELVKLAKTLDLQTK